MARFSHVVVVEAPAPPCFRCNLAALSESHLANDAVPWGWMEAYLESICKYRYSVYIYMWYIDTYIDRYIIFNVFTYSVTTVYLTIINIDILYRTIIPRRNLIRLASELLYSYFSRWLKPPTSIDIVYMWYIDTYIDRYIIFNESIVYIYLTIINININNKYLHQHLVHGAGGQWVLWVLGSWEFPKWYVGNISGWWFGKWFSFFGNIWDTVILPIDFHIFQDG